MGPLELIILILVVAWLGGLGLGYTAGGALHVLLVLAIVLVIVRLLQGRKVL